MTWKPYLEPIIPIEEWLAKLTPAQQITELEAAIDWARRGITDQDIPHLERLLAEARLEHTLTKQQESSYTNGRYDSIQSGRDA